MTLEEITSLIKTVPDFPKKGIRFKDITPILEDNEAFRNLSKYISEKIHPETTKLMCVESRGFILGSAVAQYIKAGVVLVRKPGKLPREKVHQDYELEYGTDRLEVHLDAISETDRVTVIDDVLATGGTAHAVEGLCKKMGAQVLGHVFLMEIEALKGRDKLIYPCQSLIKI